MPSVRTLYRENRVAGNISSVAAERSRAAVCGRPDGWRDVVSWPPVHCPPGRPEDILLSFGSDNAYRGPVCILVIISSIRAMKVSTRGGMLLMCREESYWQYMPAVHRAVHRYSSSDSLFASRNPYTLLLQVTGLKGHGALARADCMCWGGLHYNQQQHTYTKASLEQLGGVQ